LAREVPRYFTGQISAFCFLLCVFTTPFSNNFPLRKNLTQTCERPDSPRENLRTNFPKIFFDAFFRRHPRPIRLGEGLGVRASVPVSIFRFLISHSSF
jgi:hypothetical protein